MYYIYILQSQVSNRYYIGSTENIQQRMNLHNMGRVKSTKGYRPWSLIYFEEFNNRVDAYRRELIIKSFKGGEAFKELLNPPK